MQTVTEKIAQAKAAQAAYADCGQEIYDKVARIAAKTVFDNAKILAVEAVEETKMGTVPSKIAKMEKITKNIWFQMKDRPSKGVIGWETGKLKKNCILKIAKPAGIIVALLPSTNPTSAMGAVGAMALKGGNAVIFCPHPRAKNVSLHCLQLMREAIEGLGLGVSADVVQVIDEPSIEATQEIMPLADLVVAIGGPGMVTAAYSSGTPALGVGQGNCQVVVDRNMTYCYNTLAEKLVANRAYDSGIPCTGEQSVIVPAEDYDTMVAALKKAGAYLIEDEEKINELRKEIFKYNEDTGDYALDRKIVGLPPQKIGALVGLEIPAEAQILSLPFKAYGEDELFCREILCPITRILTYTGDWKEAVNIAETNLKMEGAGHSSDIYTNSEENQIYAGERLPVCRLVINNGNASVSGATFDNGFYTTSAIGSGYFGGSSIDVNVTFEHMLNITRLYYTVEAEREVPSDEEIWAE